MDTDDLLRRWRRTAGSADLESLPTEASYRPRWTDDEPATRPLGDPMLPDFEPGVGPGTRFVPIEAIGKGGMGVVLRARQRSLGREVAIKMLRKGEGTSRGRSAHARHNFLAEALVTGRLEHPNIVPVHDLETSADGDFVLAMKLVGGRSWKEQLSMDQREGRLDEAALVRHLDVLIQVSHALAFAHSRGVVHNDVKPANVMLGDYGEVLLMDWGVAVEVDRPPEQAWIRHRSRITSPCGTPAYMPPELAAGRGDDIGVWTDVYLLGAALHEIVTGFPPHRVGNLTDVVAHAALGKIEPFALGVPDELRKTCEKALSREPCQRHASVSAFQKEVAAFLEHRESQRLAEAAERKLDEVRDRGVGAQPLLYTGFAQAVAGFEQALRLWPANAAALAGETAARIAFAEAAISQGDLGLAEAQLAEVSSPDPAAALLVRADLGKAYEDRKREIAARRRLRIAAIGAASISLLLVAGFLYRDEARDRDAVEARRRALAENMALPLASTLGGVTRDATARVLALDALAEQGQLALGSEERAADRRQVDALLGHAAWLRRTIELATAPIEGRSRELLGSQELARHERDLTLLYGLAERLAIHNESFDLAAFVIELSPEEPADRERRQAAVELARNHRLDAWKATTTIALADLRLGRDRPERPGHMPSPDEYVLELSAYRDPEIARLLAQALAPFTARARAESADADSASSPAAFAPWTQAERDEVRMILRVLGALDLPRVTLEPLGDFLAAVMDRELAVLCGEAVAATESPAAEPLLLSARARFGAQSEVWTQIARQFPRIPFDGPEPTTAVECVARGEAFLLRGRLEAARNDFDRALASDSGLVEARSLRAETLVASGEHERALVDLGWLISRGPQDVTFLVRRGRIHKQLGQSGEARRDFLWALEIVPESAELLSELGSVDLAEGRYEEAIEELGRAIELDPEWSRAWLWRGLARRAGEDLDGALEDFTRAVQLDPKHPDARLLCAAVRQELGDLDGAIEDLGRVLELVPRNAAALNDRATAKAELGHIREAAEDYARAIAIDPGLTIAYSQRAVLLAKLGQREAAIDDAARAVELESSAFTLNNRGALFLELGDYERAFEDFDRAARLDPGLAPRIFVNRALAHEELGRDAEALADYDTALELDPGLALAYNNRGNLRSRLGDNEGALEDLLRVVRLEPASAIGCNNLGVLRKKTGDLEAALRDFDRAVSFDPAFADAFRNRGTLRLLLGDSKGALGDCSRAIELAPRHAKAWDTRGIARRELGLAVQAVADHRRAIELQPDEAGYHCNLGNALADAGDSAAADEAYGEALVRDPVHRNALKNRSILRRKMGRPDLAAQDLERALELAPEDAWLWKKRGEVYREQGAWDAALECFARSLALEPDNPLTWMERSIAHRERGDVEPAVAAAREAVRLDENDPTAWNLLGKALRNLGDLAGAEAALTRSLAIDPDFAPGLENRALVRVDRADLAAALADYDHLIALIPGRAVLHLERGQVRAALRDRSGALADLDEAVRLSPEDVETRRQRAVLRLQASDEQGALEDFERAIAGAPDDLRLALSRAAVLDLLDRLDEAYLAYDDVVRRAPRAAVAWFGRGTVLAELGEPEGAIADFTRALEIAPRLFQALMARAKALQSLGELELALEDLDQALALGTTAAMLRQRADIYREMDDFERCLADLGQAIELEPGSDGYFHQGLAHALAGSAAAARESLGRAAALADSAYPALFLHGLGGEPGLAPWAEGDGWTADLARAMLGEIDEATVLARSGEGRPSEARGRRCEAHVYLGLAAERAGTLDAALRHYRAAFETGARDFIEWGWARDRARSLGGH